MTKNFSSPKKISLEMISKSFGERTLFHNFSLEIPYETSIMIMGKSGCGKTTLLKLLMGLEKPDRGQITGVTQLKISAVFQENRLIPGTRVIDNLIPVLPAKMGRKECHLRISSILKKLELEALEKESVENLSGGMARRIAIARALLADYDLLILDEPFQGLDENTKEITAGIIREYAKGKTLVAVSHSQEDATLLQISKTLYLSS